jgi:magnesium transporter
MIRRFELTGGVLTPAESEQAPIQLYVNPDAAEREALGTVFALDEHTLSSALDPDEVSRIEVDPDRIFLIWKRPTNYSGKDTFFFNVASIGMLLLEGRLVIIVSDNMPLTTGTRHAATLNRPVDVMLGVLLMTIQHYLEHLKVIKMIARDLQGKINTSMENIHLIQMFNLSESLIYYLNAIHTNGAVLARLRSHAERAGFAVEDLEFLEDLVIENDQCYKQAEIYSTVFAGLMDARGTLINNNMSVLLKNLTIINVVFLPLNLIASIGGMSEYTQMTHGLGWRLSYLLFFVAMGVIGLLTAWLLRRVEARSTSQGPVLGARGRSSARPRREEHGPAGAGPCRRSGGKRAPVGSDAGVQTNPSGGGQTSGLRGRSGRAAASRPRRCAGGSPGTSRCLSACPPRLRAWAAARSGRWR